MGFNSGFKGLKIRKEEDYSLRAYKAVCCGWRVFAFSRNPLPCTGCINMIGEVWKLIIFTSTVKRLINTSRSERVTLQVYDTCLQMFPFLGLRRKDCLTRFTLSSDTRGRPALSPLQRYTVVLNCWYQRLMLLGDGGSLLNCRRNARWTETTDSCFANCSTQNAFCSGVAIIALLRERRGEWDCACAQNLNTCCFIPCGKLTSACVLIAVMADWNRSNHFDTPCILNWGFSLKTVWNFYFCLVYNW